MTGGGGGSGGYRRSCWVHPLPPPGPVEIHVAIRAIADEQAMVIVDGEAVISAASHARVIWG